MPKPGIVNEIVNLKGEVIALLRKGGFELAKWRSNCQSVMEEEMDLKVVIEPDGDSVLGINWNYRTDEIQFEVQDCIQPEVITKRVITSEAARVFDPQGYLAPITIRAKFAIQEQWRLRSDWDVPFSEQHQQDWRNFYEANWSNKNSAMVEYDACIENPDSHVL